MEYHEEEILHLNSNNRRYIRMGKIPVTPQMLCTAVKQLQMHELFVTSKSLGKYMQKSYPVESNLDALQEELQEKLKYAVQVGLLVKHGDDQYYLPYLRQNAVAVETAITAFWELYENKNRLRDTRKRKANNRQLLSCQKRRNRNASESDEFNSSEDSDNDRLIMKHEDYI